MPGGPIKEEEVRAKHIKFSWQKPKDPGGTDITGYVIEKMDLETGRWVTAGEVSNSRKVLLFCFFGKFKAMIRLATYNQFYYEKNYVSSYILPLRMHLS